MARQNQKKKPPADPGAGYRTRSIMGVLLKKTDEIVVRAVEYLEHETRSMYDGQIHDVEAVAAEIAVIKERMRKPRD